MLIEPRGGPEDDPKAGDKEEDLDPDLIPVVCEPRVGADACLVVVGRVGDSEGTVEAHVADRGSKGWCREDWGNLWENRVISKDCRGYIIEYSPTLYCVYDPCPFI